MTMQKRKICFIMAVMLLAASLPRPALPRQPWHSFSPGTAAARASTVGTGQSVGASSAAVNQADDADLATGATKIKVNRSKLVLGVGETFQLKASVVSEDDVDSQLNFFTYYNRISVTKKGKVTAKSTGRASVVVEASNGVVKVVWITVKKAPKKITLKDKAKTLKKGKKFQIKVVLPQKTASNKITYKSGNRKVASVSASGKVTAQKAGKTVITAKTYNGKKAQMRVTVIR